MAEVYHSVPSSRLTPSMELAYQIAELGQMFSGIRQQRQQKRSEQADIAVRDATEVFNAAARGDLPWDSPEIESAISILDQYRPQQAGMWRAIQKNQLGKGPDPLEELERKKAELDLQALEEYQRFGQGGGGGATDANVALMRAYQQSPYGQSVDPSMASAGGGLPPIEQFLAGGNGGSPQGQLSPQAMARLGELGIDVPTLMAAGGQQMPFAFDPTEMPAPVYGMHAMEQGVLGPETSTAAKVSGGLTPSAERKAIGRQQKERRGHERRIERQRQGGRIELEGTRQAGRREVEAARTERAGMGRTGAGGKGREAIWRPGQKSQLKTKLAKDPEIVQAFRAVRPDWKQPQIRKYLDESIEELTQAARSNLGPGASETDIRRWVEEQIKNQARGQAGAGRSF